MNGRLSERTLGHVGGYIIGRLNLVNKKGMHVCMHVGMGDYVSVDGRLNEQKNLTSHMKCKQKGVNGKW